MAEQKKWFDASEWLKTLQYIKLDDFFVLNIRYVPIIELNDFRITRAMHRAIIESINLEPELLELSKMDDDTFFSCMGNNVSYEYLRTIFDSESLKPVNDYFLFFFTYNGKRYEIELLREPYGDGFSFISYNYVSEAGYWHSTYPAGYSYRDYIEGKPIK